MSLKNFFNLERQVYNRFRKESAKACNVQEKDIKKIRILFLFENKKVRLLIYSSSGNFEIVKNINDFEFSETVKERAEEVLKDCYEISVIEASRDYLLQKSENIIYYISMNKERKQVNFNIF